MKHTATEKFTTTVFTFENEEGDEFVVAHSESTDIFTPEWLVEHAELGTVEDLAVREYLISLAENLLLNQTK